MAKTIKKGGNKMTLFRQVVCSGKARLSGSLVLGLFLAGASGATTIGSSSYLHVNMTQVPFSYYDNSHLASSNGYSNNCPSGSYIRGCFQTILANMAAQEVSGVRIAISFCGSPSLAFNNCGNSYSALSWDPGSNSYQQTWITNVANFFSDVKNAGISNVTITIGGDTAYTQSISAASSPLGNCSVSGDCCPDTPSTIYFVPENPYGQANTGSYLLPVGWYWDETDNNDGYNCAPINPYFIGWTNEFHVINAVLSAAYGTVNVVELEEGEELNLRDFTAIGRMIYDNSSPQSAGQAANTIVDVLSDLRSLMTNNGFNPDYVAWSSVGLSGTSATDNSCANVYTDYGQNGYQDANVEAIVGGPIGVNDDYTSTDGQMVCGGSDTGSMFTLPDYGTQPGIVDLHAYPSVYGASNTDTDIQDVAAINYGDFTHYLALASATSSVIMIGETWPGTLANSTCWPDVPLSTTPADNVAGFNSEGIGSPLSGYTVIFRPWMELSDAGGSNCYAYGSGPGNTNYHQGVNYIDDGPYTPTNY